MVHSFPTRRSSDLRLAEAYGDQVAFTLEEPVWLGPRSEEHTSELQSHHPISYAVFCLKKKNSRSSPRGVTPAGLFILPAVKPEKRHRGSALGYRRPHQVRNRRGLPFFFLMIRRPPRSTLDGTLSLHDALPISTPNAMQPTAPACGVCESEPMMTCPGRARSEEHTSELQSHHPISYAVFCL